MEHAQTTQWNAYATKITTALKMDVPGKLDQLQTLPEKKCK